MERKAPSGRGERTRAAILDAAEAEFAERGLAAARVDAIAAGAGIRRASLFYYYPDKAAIYAAVLEDRVLPYFEQVRKLLEPGLASPGSRAGGELVLRGISLQADFFARHPQVARIFLREVADFDPERPSPFAALIRPLVQQVTAFLEARAPGGAGPRVDPEHLVTAVAGASLLHVVARPFLQPDGSSAPLGGAELERHKRELTHLVARLLGLEDGTPAAQAPGGAAE